LQSDRIADPSRGNRISSNMGLAVQLRKSPLLNWFKNL